MTQRMAKSFILVGSVFCLTHCSHAPDRTIASNTMTDTNGRELGKEVIPVNEAESSKEILTLVGLGYARYKPKDLDPAAHRIIHGKQHGCVRAEFSVMDNLPKELRYGIFSHMNNTYPAWVRLSNGSGAPGHDGVPDARGLAIKLMNVPGKKLADENLTQDFLLQSSPIFFVSDVEAYVKFMKFTAHPGPAGVGELLSTIKPNDPRGRKELVLLATQSAAFIDNPLTASYYSALPQKLGPHAMKLHAEACPNQKKIPANKLRYNFLSEVMEKELNANDACIVLSVQRQTDAVAMPIEDATVKWEESKSPFIPVATIKIPKQNFRSEKRVEFCENISFNPWHTIPEHQPIGGLNRVRKLVYEHSQQFRHNLNKHTYQEPTPEDREE